MKRALLMVLLLLVGCSGEPEPSFDLSRGGEEGGVERRYDLPDGPSETTRSEVGPVRAEVSMAPAQPEFGDRIALLLEVEAERGVEVLMPPGRDALGRFQVMSYSSRELAGGSGGRIHQQRYELEARMSGKQRIPSLLVEFIDRREDPEEEAIQELLTEEIAFEVTPITDLGEDTLRPARGPLEPLPEPSPFEESSGLWLWALIGVGGALLIGLLALLLRRRSAVRDRRSAFDVAWTSLLELEEAGIPESDAELDAWYVRLSGVVRRYLEDAFGLRAPELTTEEFLKVAQGSDVLEREHRELLRELLERSDQVKFAGYRPDAEESARTIDAARRFLEESRPDDAEAHPR